MSLTQDASTGDTVIVVSCYVEGLKVGDFIALNGANYEVVGLAVPSGRRRLTAALPITLATALTGAVSSGDLVQAVRSASPPPPPPSPPPPSDDDGATNPLAPNASHCPPMCSTLAHLRRTADLSPPDATDDDDATDEDEDEDDDDDDDEDMWGDDDEGDDDAKFTGFTA